MKGNKYLLVFLSGIILAGVFFIGMAFRPYDKGENGVEVKANRKLQYKWYLPDAPDKITFAGERVPLERWEVKEALEREILSNCYRHSSTMQIIRLSGRYFPMIEQRLRANGVPDDFKYLCVAESSLTNASSPVGAKGFWQFMSGTAPRYGLEVYSEVDERYHVEKATDAACKYLKEAYAKFGSWTAAAASYNCGQGGYNKYSDYQAYDNYYDLLLPAETMRYIYRIVAFKHIMSNPERVGFTIHPDEMYKPVPTRTITVTESISNLAEFASYHGTSYKMLKILNPWLREHTLAISKGNSYQIDLPR